VITFEEDWQLVFPAFNLACIEALIKIDDPLATDRFVVELTIRICRLKFRTVFWEPVKVNRGAFKLRVTPVVVGTDSLMFDSEAATGVVPSELVTCVRHNVAFG
jgi:hypothetical protein